MGSCFCYHQHVRQWGVVHCTCVLCRGICIDNSHEGKRGQYCCSSWDCAEIVNSDCVIRALPKALSHQLRDRISSIPRCRSCVSSCWCITCSGSQASSERIRSGKRHTE